MAPTESRPYWGWAVKGMGGCLTILESFVRDGCAPEKHQIDLVEYQLARLTEVYEAISQDDRPPRARTEINKTRWFADQDVLHFVGSEIPSTPAETNE